MKKSFLLIPFLLFLFSFTPIVFAESSVASIAPTATQLDDFGDGPSGAELFVFLANAVGSTYTIVFNVDEEPASVVGLPGEINSYDYDSGAGTLSVEFNHTGYAEGTVPPGPPTSFSIALVAAVGVGEDGPPAAMKGSYMGTNLGPADWMLLPPSEDDPAFGFQLSGAKGTTAFFQFFVPEGMITFLSDVFDEELTAEDLAAFNNGTETTVSVVASGTGALIAVDVLFTAATTLESADDEVQSAVVRTEPIVRKSLSKQITVNKASDLPLSANKKKVKQGGRVLLQGCVNDHRVSVEEGEKVILSSSLRNSNGKKMKFKAALDSQYCYSKGVKLQTSATFRALLKQNSELGRDEKFRSDRVKVKVK
ncbi:MAG: hypothetical protein KDD55_01785 [Bdellovibrionales bacterium]|nr:hypothetical protein [Bdellovibrionales bacterium]